MVVDVGALNFQAEVVERSRRQLVVVDFWAPWCGPCRVLGPILEKLAGEGGGAWVLAKLDTDQHQELAQRFQIQGIPAVKAFRDGRVVADFVGALPEPKVRAWLAALVPSEASLLAQRAAEAAAGGDAPLATQLFEEALARDPDQADAVVFLAADAVTRGDRDGARRWLQRLSPEGRERHRAEVGRLEFAVEAPPFLDVLPEDTAGRYGQGLARAAAGRYEEALAVFLSIVKTDRAYGDDAARRAMLRVFDVVGARSPLADEWRGRLGMELYK